MKNNRLVKSPLSGYWLLYVADQMIELGVKTKDAAKKKATKLGYQWSSVQE